MKNQLIQYLLVRLEERSTWIGIITFAASALGLSIAPQLQDAIVAAATALMGVVAVLVPDKHPAQNSDEQK